MPSSRVRIWFPDGYDNVCLTAQTIMGMGWWDGGPRLSGSPVEKVRRALLVAVVELLLPCVRVSVVRRRLFPSMGFLLPSPK